MNKKTQRYFGLDLLRTLSIYGVMGGHLSFLLAYLVFKHPHSGLFGILGELGVDAFFVMSGFLIGTILLRITDNGVSVSAWKIFLIRRCMRIWPPYFIWVFILFIVAPPHWH